MRFSEVAVAAVAHVDAPIRVTTESIADELGPFLDRIGLPRRALQGLSGIVARRFWPANTPPSHAATLAAEHAIAASGLDRAQLGVLINTSVCRDYVEPSTACIVHGNLGLGGHTLNFDLANACLGFINGMELVATMIERGDVEAGIVVDGENSREVTEKTIARLLAGGTTDDFRAEFAALTLGSGGAAAVLVSAKTQRERGERVRPYRGGLSIAATQHNRLCIGHSDRMVTDSNGLLHAGIDLAEQTWARGKADFGWHERYFGTHVLHQVSKTHTEQLMKRLGLALETTLPIYAEHGNIGPAAVPMAWSKSLQAGRIADGDRVALMGIGSGLNCAMVEVQW